MRRFALALLFCLMVAIHPSACALPRPALSAVTRQQSASLAGASPITHRSSPISPQRVKSEVRSILSTREFRAAWRPSWLLELQEKVINLVFDIINWLASVLSRVEWRPTHLRGFLEWTIAVLAYGLAAVGIVGLLYVMLQVGRRLLAAPAGRTPRPASGSAESDVRSADEALRLAAERAQRGEFRDAFRAAYLAVLLWMDSQRMVEYVPSRTNWEYVRAAAGSFPSSVHEPLRTLTGIFDRKVYGGETCGAADYEAALSAYNTISAVGAAAQGSE